MIRLQMIHRFLALLTLAVSGCDPGYDVIVQVVDADGRPVPGVEVQMDCPPAGLARYKHHLALGTTDGTGRAHQAGIGEVKLECWLHAPLQKSDRADVAGSCGAKHPYLGLCSRLSATLHLPTRVTDP